MKANKLAYLLTPPVVQKLFTRFLKRKKTSVGLQDDLGGQEVLKAFKRERFDFFFKEQLIDEFCSAMHEHFYENPPVKTKDIKNQPYLDELVKNGFCKIEGLFSADQIKEWHDAVYPQVAGELEEFARLVAEHGIASGKDINIVKNDRRYAYDLRSGIIRIWQGATLCPSISPGFASNPIRLDICNSYLSGKANTSDVYVDFKGVPLAKDANFLLHADNMFKQVKVFLPLSEVKIENAPFIYYKKSHRVHEWRLLKDFLTFTNYNSKYNSAYCQWDDIEMGRFAEKFPELAELESVVTTNVGDVIIADTRGVHGGSLLHPGCYRLQLGLSYAMLGDFHCGYTPEHIRMLAKNVGTI